MTSPNAVPPQNAARYKAGEIIHNEGPKTESELIAAGIFGVASKARDNLRRSLETGWLLSTRGVLSCGAAATEHYKARANKVDAKKLQAPEPQPVGQIVPPRFVNLMDRPAYVPARRFVRADAMDNSLAAMPSKFYEEQA